ncbi:MAG TPA: 3-hydroxyacyl-CoA dehydrogenase NAD-binding domain-containing protein [Planctomycetota bacterium]
MSTTPESLRAVVIGAGTMGNGIAQTFAMAGHAVHLVDVSDEAVQRGKATIEKSLARFVKKGVYDEARAKAVGDQVRCSTDLEAAVSDADFVVEAVVEREDVKKDVFRRVDAVAPQGAILATNTSSIPITRLAAVTTRPDKFIGMHFMNPVPIMKLVEVIRGNRTSDATVQRTIEVSEGLGKVVGVAQDYPGFVSNRILMPLINEAAFCVYEHLASNEDIDKIIKLGMNHPMGPLTLADFVGIDVIVDVLDVLYQGFGDSKFRCCPLLRQMVAAGKLGRKSGEGFYKYD